MKLLCEVFDELHENEVAEVLAAKAVETVVFYSVSSLCANVAEVLAAKAVETLATIDFYTRRASVAEVLAAKAVETFARPLL